MSLHGPMVAAGFLGIARLTIVGYATVLIALGRRGRRVASRAV